MEKKPPAKEPTKKRVGTFSDCKQPEESLCLLKFSIENSSEAAYWVGRNGRLTYVNKAACRSLGYSRQELLSMTVHDIDPAFPSGSWPASWQHLKEQKTIAIESYHRSKDGKMFPVEIRGNFLEFNGKEYNCCFSRDISEQKQMELKLREAEKRYRTLFEQSPDAVVIIDPETLTPIEFNENMLRMTGYSHDEFKKLNIPDFDATETPEEVKAHCLQTMQKGKNVFETKIRTRDGELLDVWVNTQYVEISGQHVFVTIIRDITERIKAEEERRNMEAQIQYSQKLESLGVLAGGIAHDFNNLLMGILGNADLALTELSEDSRVRPAVSQIKKIAQRAAELTNQLLTYSGKGKFVSQSLSLSRVVEEMTHMLKTVISKKAVLELNVAGSLPSIEGDPSQIRQVVMNLITNASDSIGDNSGIISVSTGSVKVRRSDLSDSSYESNRRLDFSKLLLS